MQPQTPDGALPEELLGAAELLVDTLLVDTCATVVAPVEAGALGAECEYPELVDEYPEPVVEDPELVDGVEA